MSKVEKNRDYYEEIFIKYDLNEINSFDYVVLRMKIPQKDDKSKDLIWRIYCLPDDKKTKINFVGNSTEGILLSTIRGQKSGWVEWKVDANQIKKLSKETVLSLKIIVTDRGTKADFISLFYKKIKCSF